MSTAFVLKFHWRFAVGTNGMRESVVLFSTLVWMLLLFNVDVTSPRILQFSVLIFFLKTVNCLKLHSRTI